MSHSCFVGSFVEDVNMTKRVYEDDNISDEILNSVFDELEEEEQHGGSLFEFEFQKVGSPNIGKIPCIIRDINRCYIKSEILHVEII